MNTRNHSYKDRKYDVQSYNPEWPLQFEQYAEKVRAIFGDVQIEHIGSTAVPGMVGKPCIDMLVIIKDLKAVEDNVSKMEQVGFVYAGQFVMEGSRLFRVMKDNEVFANIHFFLEGHTHTAEMISLRDYLRSHPKEVQEYSKLKESLYSKYENDYASYRKYKDEYMDEMKKRVAGE
jgi:GrpB-like predicted nucleotidyltransferase (UPF0157 family)